MRNIVAKRVAASSRVVVVCPGSVAWKSRSSSKSERSRLPLSKDLLPPSDGKLDLMDAKGVGKSLHTDVAAFLAAERDL